MSRLDEIARLVTMTDDEPMSIRVKVMIIRHQWRHSACDIKHCKRESRVKVVQQENNTTSLRLCRQHARRWFGPEVDRLFDH